MCRDARTAVTRIASIGGVRRGSDHPNGCGGGGSGGGILRAGDEWLGLGVELVEGSEDAAGLGDELVPLGCEMVAKVGRGLELGLQ